MAEEQFNLRPVGVRMRCDACQDGEMVSTDGIMLTTSPPLYPHSCNRCDRKANLRVRYPTVRWLSDE